MSIQFEKSQPTDSLAGVILDRKEARLRQADRASLLLVLAYLIEAHPIELPRRPRIQNSNRGKKATQVVFDQHATTFGQRHRSSSRTAFG